MTEYAPYRIPRATVWWSAAFVVLGVLVQATDFDRLNAFAVHHLEPIAPGHGYPLLTSVAEAVVSPGAPLTSAVIIGAAAVWLWTRGRRREAVAWALTYPAAIMVEVVCKLLIQQHRSGVWQGFGLTFDSSFPSGHMLRAILITGVLSALRPALRGWLAVWCGAVAVCMLLTGFHLPTDIAGGIMAGMALATAAEAAGVRRSTWPPSSPSSSPPAGEARDLQGTFGSR
jgi:membrane-associated phospholipid phosphatase